MMMKKKPTQYFSHNTGPAEAVKNWVGPINPGLTGPFSPKKWVGPTICFALFLPKSGGARAQPAHIATPAL